MKRSIEWRGRMPLERAPIDEPTEDPEWRSARERGSVAGIKAIIIFATMFGRGPARIVVALIAVYYTAFSRRARRSVRLFRTRLGLPPSRRGLRATFMTVLRFAQCALDGLVLMRGKIDYFRVTRNGHEHLAKLRDTRQSAILLGAHVGSFYVMRTQSTQESLPLCPVVYTKNARRFNRVIEELDPESTTRLIEIGDGEDMDFMLAIRDKAEAGALIAILGDRTQPGAKTVEVDFLGAKALLPAGPYILASMLRLPVYFTAGIYEGGNHYDLHCIPFAERIVLDRRDRLGSIQRYAQQYADIMAEFCRKAPDNWFNFYDFWGEQ